MTDEENLTAEKAEGQQWAGMLSGGKLTTVIPVLLVSNCMRTVK